MTELEKLKKENKKLRETCERQNTLLDVMLARVKLADTFSTIAIVFFLVMSILRFLND